MATWVVQNREAGEVVYAYSADSVDHDGLYPFSIYNHIRQKEEIASIAPIRRRITKQEFLDLLGSAAVAFILTAAKSDVGVESWVKRLDLVTPDPDGTSVDLDDPRTIAGVEQLEQLLYAKGIVPADWAKGVLDGNGL